MPFRLLNGLLRASGGEIRVAGRKVFIDRVEIMRLVGLLPDEPVFYSYLSGREILELSAAMHGLYVAITPERIAPVITQLRMTDALGNAEAA